MGWLIVLTVVFHGHIHTKTIGNDFDGHYTNYRHCQEDLWILTHAIPKKGVVAYASCEEEAFFLWSH